MGQLRLSDEEFEWKKKNGILFKCPEKWSRTHSCRNKQLQVMIVCQGMELEVLEEEFQDASDQLQETVTEVIELSLHSFMGWSSSTTMKLEGKIGKTMVVVLIDSGATHNFLAPSVVHKARLTRAEEPGFTVMVGTGIKVAGSGLCKGVQLQLQKVRITTDFVILEPGCAYIILGVQWLRTLGRCEVDWAQQEMTFNTKDGKVTLYGDQKLHKPQQVQELAATGIDWVNHQLSLFNSEVITGITVVPEIQEILDEFEQIFREPTELPPVRGFEHSIRLSEGTWEISVRPYRYPHAYMEAIEKIVSEMLRAGLIRKSRSPFASPVLLVKKKT